MRKASLIISIITIPVYILYSIYMGNVLEKMVELEKERGNIPPDRYFNTVGFVITMSIIICIIVIIVIIASQVLLNKGKKVAAGVLTLLFVSKIAGILMFCLPRTQYGDYIPNEGEGTTSGWTCPECGTRNVLVDVCSKCGYTSPEASKAYSEKINQILAEDEKNNTATRARNKCPYCSNVVSKFDESCPFCGHKLF